jgi:DnaJ like chaperone protein
MTSVIQLQQFLGNADWWGKILGGFFGYLMAGPIGIFIGVLVGNFFDKALSKHVTHPYWHLLKESSADVQALFLETTFSLLGHIAKADGRVSENEIQKTYDIMESMRLTRKQRKLAKIYFTQGKEAHFQKEPLLTLFKNACRNHPDLLQSFINIQFSMAQSDGLSDKKIHILNSILKTLGFATLHNQNHFYEDNGFNSRHSQSSSRRQNRPVDEPIHTHNKAHAILGTNPQSSQEEVKKAYRRLISRNHPDRLIAKGASPEAVKQANNKTQAIRKAYEELCESKGWG